MKQKNQTKVVDDVFEEYMVRVVDLYSTNGMRTATERLRALWSISIEDNIRIKAEEKKRDKSEDYQGFSSSFGGTDLMLFVDKSWKLIG